MKSSIERGKIIEGRKKKRKGREEKGMTFWIPSGGRLKSNARGEKKGRRGEGKRGGPSV